MKHYLLLTILVWAGGAELAMARWYPSTDDTLSIQFAESVTAEQDFAGSVVEVDMFGTEKSVIKSLKQAGKHVVCYIDVGTLEDWRADAADFPAKRVGKANSGWEGENWLDVRSRTVQGILAERLSLAKSKGCEAVDLDNVDGYTQDTGFHITYKNQRRFNRLMAEAAHARGLSVGLKNVPEMVQDLFGDFDFAVTEDCDVYGECAAFTPFIGQDKPVWAILYTDTHTALSCTLQSKYGFGVTLKNRELDEYEEICD